MKEDRCYWSIVQAKGNPILDYTYHLTLQSFELSVQLEAAFRRVAGSTLSLRAAKNTIEVSNKIMQSMNLMQRPISPSIVLD